MRQGTEEEDSFSRASQGVGGEVKFSACANQVINGSLFSGLVLRLFLLLFVSVKSQFITYQMAYIVTKSVS